MRNGNTGRQFPIQGGGTVPWALAEEAYKTYAAAWGKDQSLERLAERHGFGGMEFAILLAGKTDATPHEQDRIVAACIRKVRDAVLEEARIAGFPGEGGGT